MNRDEIMQMTLDVGIDAKGELISEHYLKDRLKKNKRFKEIAEEAEDKFDEVKKIYENVKSTIDYDDEDDIKQDLIEPVLSELGHTKDRRHREAPFLSHKGREEVPDYVLFNDKEDKDEAKRNKDDSDRYFDLVIGLVEAKSPNKDLDQGRKENPSVQTKRYLRMTKTKWGFLTNGRKWRLYCGESGYSSNVYLEFDLFSILEHDRKAVFRFFYVFFSHESLKRDGKRPFLDEIYDKNVKFEREVEDDLEKNVYEALRILSEGFLKFGRNDLDENDLDDIHDSSLILLYRMLFLFYAESKGLIDFNYKRNSILQIREDVREDLKNNKKYAPLHTDYWRRVKESFDIVNLGSKGVLGEEGIPPYNGGLFDPNKHSFLEENEIGNNYLMRAVDRLGVREEDGEMQLVDYETLQIRHLGSIYEKLLEYKLDVAGCDLTVDDGEYVEAEDDDEVLVEEGEVYLKTDKGERKATGSYYTPDYIVEYIVENTVGELIEERTAEAQEENESEAQAILDIKVLDPAMGSGHFLVGAVEYMAEELVAAVHRDIENGLWDEEEMDANEAKREVVSHCIYGVDVNPLAVELAKLSLWLTTLSEGKPLNFLNHRLKCGNSLIGASLNEINYYPTEKNKMENGETTQTTIPSIFIDRLLDKISELEEIQEDSIESVKKKERVFNEFKSLESYNKTKATSNVYTSVFFGNEVKPTKNKDAKNVYYDLLYSLDYQSNWEQKTKKDWFKKAQKIAKNKSFFHWELEYPEVFFEDGGFKEDPGFDVVIGNPPYVSNWNLSETNPELKNFLGKKFSEVAVGHWDLFIPFTEKSLNLVGHKGKHSFVVPTSFGMEKYGRKLREKILETFSLKKLTTFGVFKAFGEEIDRQFLIYVVENSQKDTLTQIDIFDFEESRFKNTIKIDQNKFSNLPNNTFRPDVTEQDVEIKDKLDRNPKLGNICCVNVGVVSHSSSESSLDFTKDDVIFNEKKKGNFKKYIGGSEVSRYYIDWKGRYMDYEDKKEHFHRPKFKKLFESEKIIISRVSGEGGRISSCFDKEGFYSNDNLIHSTIWTDEILEKQSPKGWEIIDLKKDYSIEYINGLVNSALLTYYFTKFFATDTLQGTYSGIYPEDVRNLPLYHPQTSLDKELKIDINDNVEGIISNKKELKSLVLDFYKYINEYELEGKKLKDIVPTSNRELLSEKWGKGNQKDYSNLKFEDIKTIRKGNKVLVRVDLKWVENKEEQDPPYDYTKQENIELLKIEAEEPLIDLIELYLPIAETRDPGGSSKTTVIQRIINLEIPDIPEQDLEEIINDYRKNQEKRNEIKNRIQQLENKIDAIVFDLYDLTEEEVETVLDSLDTDEEEKVDIMEKFREI